MLQYRLPKGITFFCVQRRRNGRRAALRRKRSLHFSFVHLHFNMKKLEKQRLNCNKCIEGSSMGPGDGKQGHTLIEHACKEACEMKRNGSVQAAVFMQNLRLM